jgi:hypothetical protein
MEAIRRLKKNSAIVKSTLSLIAVSMVFSLFSTRATAGSEVAFWKWFAANETRLFSFEKNQDAIFDELSAQMSLVNADLTFEFGPVSNGRREFVISAGGIKAAFPYVEALYNKAPPLPRWIWIKYRPRRLPINDLNYGGKSIKADAVRFLLTKDDDKVGIVLFFEGYNEKEKGVFGQIGYLFLDEALGEYSVETQVGFIEFRGRDSQYFAQSHPLKELPQHFDEQVGHTAY